MYENRNELIWPIVADGLESWVAETVVDGLNLGYVIIFDLFRSFEEDVAYIPKRRIWEDCGGNTYKYDVYNEEPLDQFDKKLEPNSEYSWAFER